MTNPNAGTEVSVSFKMTLGDIILLLHIFFVFLAVIGMLLVWFEANLLNGISAGSAEGGYWFTLTVAVVLFAASKVPNNFVPQTHRDTLRHFGLLLFLTNIDGLICAADGYFNYSFSQQVEGNAARAGAVLVLVAVFASFVFTFCLPGERSITDTAKAALTIRGFASVVAAVFLLVGQALTWGLKNNCDFFGTYGFYLRNSNPIILAVLLVATVLLDDRGTHDVVFFMVLRYIFTVVPMFPAGPPATTQSNFMDVYKAEICILFIGALIYFFGVSADRTVAFFGQSKPEGTLVQRLTSKGAILQIVLILLAIPGGIMIWTWSTHWVPIDQDSRTACYLGAIAFVVPILNFLVMLTDFDYLTAATQVLSFHMAPMLAYLLLPPAGMVVDSYYRAGVLLQLFVVTLSPPFAFLANRKTPVEDFSQSASKDSSSLMLNLTFVAWCLAAAYSWYESLVVSGDGLFASTVYPSVGMIAALLRFTARNKDAQRVLYLELLMLVSNSQVWPFTSTPIFSRVFITITGMLSLHLNATESKGAALEAIHGPQDSAGESSPHRRAKDPVP